MIKGGSHGKGTALPDRMEADCVLVWKKFEAKQVWMKGTRDRLVEVLKPTGWINMDVPVGLRCIKLRVDDIDIDLLIGGGMANISSFFDVEPRDYKYCSASASQYQLDAIERMPHCYKIAVRMAKWLLRCRYKDKFKELGDSKDDNPKGKPGTGWQLASCAIEVLVGHAYHQLMATNNLVACTTDENSVNESAILIFVQFLIVAQQRRLHVRFAGIQGDHQRVGDAVTQHDGPWCLTDPGNPTDVIHVRSLTCKAMNELADEAFNILQK
jgi:hypothetical protein